MRIISRIDVKNEYVIKGINLEGLRKVGDPLQIATNYYEQGIDEIIMIDAVASLYKRNNLFNIIKKSVENIFVPFTLGGGIRSLQDIEKALKSGADKVAINSYATENPNFIREAVRNFGSSTISVYIEAKKIDDQKWEAYKNSGRDKTGLDVVEWIKKIQEFECGEILLTSIDFEGLQQGFDIELIDNVYNDISVPLIVNGGCGNIDDIFKAKKKFENISFAIASAFHYKKISISDIKLHEKNLYT